MLGPDPELLKKARSATLVLKTPQVWFCGLVAVKRMYKVACFHCQPAVERGIAWLEFWFGLDGLMVQPAGERGSGAGLGWFGLVGVK